MIDVKKVGKTFTSQGRTLTVLQDVSFSLDQGSFVTIVGPSGCGKSTLLQIIAGLVPPTRGMVTVDNTPVSGPPADLIYVFQQYTKSIFPWKTVKQNTVFGLANRGVPKKRMDELAAEYTRLVGLEGFENHYPWQLSGGMQQRVAIARALVCQPKILMMDEPFSSLDAMTRATLQDLVLKIWRQYKLTILFITHDIEEAIYLSERVLVMGRNPGRVIEEIPIDVPYPRDQLHTRESPKFLQYRQRLFTSVFGVEFGQGRGEQLEDLAN